MKVTLDTPPRDAPFPPDMSLENNEEAVGDIRYIHSGEIYFNIASAIKFAPFVRRIGVPRQALDGALMGSAPRAVTIEKAMELERERWNKFATLETGNTAGVSRDLVHSEIQLVLVLRKVN